MKKALMIGSTVADILIRVDHLPSLEEDVNPFGQTIALGGCCYNVSSVLGTFDVPYTLFSPVGKGIYGEFIEHALHENGMEPFLRSDEENGCCYCVIDKDGNRTFMAVHGAEYRFRREWFDDLDVSEYSDVYICGLELEEDTGVHIVDFLRANPQLNIYFAPSSRILAVPKDRMAAVLSMHPMMHLNKREANSWLIDAGFLNEELSDTRELCHKLFVQTGNLVVITDGANGAWAFDGRKDYMEKAFPADVTDGTGAGDTHLGTLIAMRMKGMSIKAALRCASFTSARIVEQNGAVLRLSE